MHAGTQHILVSPVVFRNVGRELAGIAPNGRWMLLDLVEGA